MTDVHTSGVDARRVGVFLVVAFGIAYATGAAVFFTGGLRDSPVLVEALNLTLATVMIATVYMFSPAVANVLTRVVTDEGFDDHLLRPRLADGWRYWVLAWVGPPVLVVLGAGAYFLAFPGQFDPSMTGFREAVESAAGGQPLPFGPAALLVVQLVVGVTLGAVINSVFTLGEEFGWRAYLLPKLLPMGGRTAVVLSGVVWGAWHWPIIAMGYNYGFDYPGAPWTGLLAMAWFTVVVGVFLSFVTLRSGSVWPAVLGHAVLNAVAGIAVPFLAGDPTPLLGPLPVGVVGSLPFTAVALWILVDEDHTRPPKEWTESDTGVGDAAGTGLDPEVDPPGSV